MSKQVRRLFEQFQPQNYKLDLSPDAESMTFKGTVTISGKKTSRPSERLTFHQKNLKINSAKIIKVSKGEQSEVGITRINLHKSYDEVRLHADETLYPGQYIIEIDFEGEITEPMHGLYPCYFEHEGQKKKLLATQFESHHAREVFPCIDEPEAKASFDLTLNTPEGVVVLANTPEKSQTTQNSLMTTVFETTPIMSTYLLAFVIGELHKSEAKTSDGVTIRTWGTIAQPAEFLDYATKEAVKILEFFVDYFQTPFPLKKCDQVALPDFESGAMENWGLITYREIALLADPHNRSQSSEQYISMVVAHELSHQWFGNLVTMKWWDDLWLNESFASIMEHVALDSLNPDWSQWEQYTASDVISCSSRDVFKNVQAVHVQVNHPDEISTLFDPAIVYAKGGRLLKMLREYIGDEAFRSGLQSYFKKFAYKNTVGNDLWEELSKASGKNVGDFMTPWISQSGMPVLSVEQAEAEINLSQQRFVLDSLNDKSLWPIPLLADQALSEQILDKKSTTISKPSDKPIIFNKYGSGHMLVNYTDQASKDYVSESFSKQTLLPESRINVLNDSILLSRGGINSIVDGLKIVRASTSESRDSVWMIMARVIGTASILTDGDEATEKSIKRFKQSLTKDWYQNLGWDDLDGDDPNTKALRQTILSLTISSEYQPALEEAVERYKKSGNVTNVTAEQRGMVAGVIARQGRDYITALIEEHKNTSNPDVQLAICSGLCSVKKSDDIAFIIDATLGKDGFARPQDIFRWYAYLARNRHSRLQAWQWLKSNWDRLEKLFGDSKSFDYFIAFTAAVISTSDRRNEFVEFFKDKEEIISLKRDIEIAKAEINARVEWRTREEDNIKQYFSDF